jgi:hypothetical protein
MLLNEALLIAKSSMGSSLTSPQQNFTDGAISKFIFLLILESGGAYEIFSVSNVGVFARHCSDESGGSKYALGDHCE